MSKPRQIQIPETLWQEIISYFLSADPSEEQRQVILTGISEKLKAQERRSLYAASKTAPTPEAREENRQAYLDRRGIPKDFRY